MVCPVCSTTVARCTLIRWMQRSALRQQSKAAIHGSVGVGAGLPTRWPAPASRRGSSSRAASTFACPTSRGRRSRPPREGARANGERLYHGHREHRDHHRHAKSARRAGEEQQRHEGGHRRHYVDGHRRAYAQAAGDGPPNVAPPPEQEHRRNAENAVAPQQADHFSRPSDRPSSRSGRRLHPLPTVSSSRAPEQLFASIESYVYPLNQLFDFLR